MGKMKELETKLNSLAAAGDREGLAEEMHKLFDGSGMDAQKELTRQGLIEKDAPDWMKDDAKSVDGYLRSLHDEQEAGEDQWLTYADSMIRIVKGKENEKDI